MTTEIQTIDKSIEVETKNQYMIPRKARIYTSTSYDNNMPGMVGLSIFIECENNGTKFNVGKTKCVEDKILPKIRTHLDKFGKEFTACSMENTSSSSFKSLLEQMLDHVVSNTNLEDEE